MINAAVEIALALTGVAPSAAPLAPGAGHGYGELQMAELKETLDRVGADIVAEALEAD